MVGLNHLSLKHLNHNSMKKFSTRFFAFLLFFAILLFSQTTKSQVIISLLLGDKLNSDKIEFGVDGGFNWSYLSGIDNTKDLTSFYLGFYFDFKLKEHWYLNTGVRVKSNVGATNITPYSVDDKDVDTVFFDGHITRKIGYFYVPAHIKYRFGKQFFAMAGFQVGLRNSTNDNFTNTVYEKDDVEFKYDIGDYVKRLDAGLSGGVGYKFKGTGMNLGITYYYGLVDIMKDSDLAQYNINSKNSSIYIYVSIPVGAHKSEEERKK